MYDVNQEQYTMLRAAYGDSPAAYMAAGGVYPTPGGAYGPADPLFTDPLAVAGAAVQPVRYVPPPRMATGYYGTYALPSSLFSSAIGAAGFPVPRSMYAMDFQTRSAYDVGERVGGGVVGAGLQVGALTIGSLLGAPFGTVGSIAGGIGTMMLAGQIQDSITQRRALTNYLENASFRFVGPQSQMADPRLGRGLSIGATRDITNFIRQTELKDPFMNMEDMSTILKQGVSGGMFVGTTDMDDFKRKFKDLTDTVRVVTKALNTSLEEGLRVIKDMKNIGIDPLRARGMLVQSEALGRVAGRTGLEMVGIGMQGAEVFRGTGIDMSIGFQATQMNLARIRALRDAGQLSLETIAQLGGEESAAQQQNVRAMAYGQSAMGRGLNAAFFVPGMGFDQAAFMRTAMAGGEDIFSMATRAAGNLKSPAGVISYTANQAKMLSDMGKMFGNQGLTIGQNLGAVGYAQMLAQQTGATNEESLKFAFMQQGMTDPEADLAISNMRNAGRTYMASQQGLRDSYLRQQYEASRLNSPIWRFYAEAKETLGGAAEKMTQPALNYIDTVKEDVARWYSRMWMGREDFTTRGINTRAFMGGRTDEQRKVDAAVEGAVTGAVDLRGLGGERVLKGIDLLNKLQASTGVKPFQVSEVTKEEAEIKNLTILGESTESDKVRVIDRKGQQQLATLAETFTDMVFNIDKVKDLDEYKKIKVKKLTELPFGSMENLTNVNAASMAILGKTWSDTTRFEKIRVFEEIKDRTKLGDEIKKVAYELEASKNIEQNVLSKELSNVVQSRKETEKQVREMGATSTLASQKYESTWEGFKKELATNLGWKGNVLDVPETLYKGAGELISSRIEKFKAVDLQTPTEVMDLLADAFRMRESDDMGVRRSADEKIKLAEDALLKANPTAETGDVLRHMNRLMESKDIMKKWSAQSRLTGTLKQKIETGLVTTVARQELIKQGKTREEVDKIIPKITALQGALFASPQEFVRAAEALGADRGVLRSTMIGGRLFDLAELQGKISGATNVADIEKAVSDAKDIPDSQNVLEYIKSHSKDTDIKEKVQAMLMERQQTAFTQEAFATGDVAGGPRGGAEKTAVENLETQMRINLTVYQVMDAMARKMGLYK